MFRSCRFHEIYRYYLLGARSFSNGQLYIKQSGRWRTVQFYERYSACGIDCCDYFNTGLHDEESKRDCRIEQLTFPPHADFQRLGVFIYQLKIIEVKHDKHFTCNTFHERF